MFRSKQNGVALFISLVLLLVLTIIGISSVQTTSLEVRMTRNEHDSMLAFQAAESALRDAEAQLEGVTSLANFTDTGDNGRYNVADLGDPEHYLWNK
jgi:type IV pilus assembly protein PilX